MRTLTNKEITNSHNFNFTFFVYLGRSWGGHWPGNIDITKYRFYMQLESTLLYRNIETSCNRSNRRTSRPFVLGLLTCWCADPLKPLGTRRPTIQF